MTLEMTLPEPIYQSAEVVLLVAGVTVWASILLVILVGFLTYVENGGRCLEDWDRD